LVNHFFVPPKLKQIAMPPSSLPVASGCCPQGWVPTRHSWALQQSPAANWRNGLGAELVGVLN
jgi:hypothetical protein